MKSPDRYVVPVYNSIVQQVLEALLVLKEAMEE